MKVFERGSDLIDNKMDIFKLIINVQQLKTYVKKNLINWSKLKDVIHDNECKHIIKTGLILEEKDKVFFK